MKMTERLPLNEHKHCLTSESATSPQLTVEGISKRYQRRPKGYETGANVEILGDGEGVVGDYHANPEYQREAEAWKSEQQAEYISSLLTFGHPVKALMFEAYDVNNLLDHQKEYFNDGYRFGVIDGQHRIESLCAFIAGDFKIQINGGEVSFEDLHVDDQKDFLARQVHGHWYFGYSETEIRDIFLGEQMGRSLTRGEKYRGYVGNSEFFKGLVEIYHNNFCSSGDELTAKRSAKIAELVMPIALIEFDSEVTGGGRDLPS
jgi:hypothetical protein